MTRARIRGVLGLAVAAALLGALLAAMPSSAQPRPAPTGQCVFNADCQSPLVCSGQYCRAQCASDRDCAAGYYCALGPDPSKNVCVALPPAPPRNPLAPPMICVYDFDCVGFSKCDGRGQCH